MKISIDCTYCKKPHFDHYECSNCGGRLRLPIYNIWGNNNDTNYLEDQKRRNPPWNYCPYCGEKL